NPRLQNKIRTEQEEKNQEEGDDHQRKKDEPAEVIFLRSAELHEGAAAFGDRLSVDQESVRASDLAVSSGRWKLMIPLIGRLSVNIWTISMPARSMSCCMVFTREER